MKPSHETVSKASEFQAGNKEIYEKQLSFGLHLSRQFASIRLIWPGLFQWAEIFCIKGCWSTYLSFSD